MHAVRAAIFAVAAVALLFGGCGGDDTPTKDSLAWFDPPKVIVPKTLKHDRILQADVHNDSR